MNDMEKCFYEPAELSVVDEGKGCSLVKAKGSPYKLGFLVAQGADGIFKSLNDAEAVDAMERAIVGTHSHYGDAAQGGVREPQRCVRYEQRFQRCPGRGCAERNS